MFSENEKTKLGREASSLNSESAVSRVPDSTSGQCLTFTECGNRVTKFRNREFNIKVSTLNVEEL